MRVHAGSALALVLGIVWLGATADELKSGPEKRVGGAFQVKAFSGANTGKSLCYV